MRKISCSFVASFLCIAVGAQTPLKTPLNYVSADSIVVWGGGICDFRLVAYSVDDKLTPKPTAAPDASFRKNMKEWEDVWLPMLTPAGFSSPSQPSVNPTQCQRMLELAAALFQQSGHADFMEATERTLLNDLLHCVFTAPTVSMERHIAAQTLLDAMGSVYATDEEGLYINLFMNSTARIRTPHFRCVVDQLTAFPFESRLRVRLSSLPHNSYPLKVRLRRPLWACDTTINHEKWRVVVSQDRQTCVPLVNGREILQLYEDDGYFVIDRRWNNGDEILIEFPNAPRLLVNSSEKDAAATLRRGPLLYTVTSPSAPGVFSNKPLGDDYSEEYPVVYGTFQGETKFTAYPYAITKGNLWNRASE